MPAPDADSPLLSTFSSLPALLAAGQAEGTGVEPEPVNRHLISNQYEGGQTQSKHECKRSRAKSRQMSISLGYFSVNHALGTASRPIATN